jgi:hypothetical protein
LNTRKNQNSILILATLGVYLGLVLVGATPQVLAQAAMTRQFNVKDEVEVKDDLDKKPDSSVTEDKNETSPKADKLVSNSVDKFLSEYSPSVSSASIGRTHAGYDEVAASAAKHKSSAEHHIPLMTLIAVTNLPRAGLEPLFAVNAK